MQKKDYELIETHNVKLIFQACLSTNQSISIFKTIHDVSIRVPRQVQKHKDHRARILKAQAGSSDIFIDWFIYLIHRPQASIHKPINRRSLALKNNKYMHPKVAHQTHHPPPNTHTHNHTYLHPYLLIHTSRHAKRSAEPLFSTGSSSGAINRPLV